MSHCSDQEINFDEEYMKLIKIFNTYNAEYQLYLKSINLREFVTQLEPYDILNNESKRKLNILLNIQVKINEPNNNPNNADNNDNNNSKKIKMIKKKILLKYLHPDKITCLYGESINNDHKDYFCELMKKINNNTSFTSLSILLEIHKDNLEIFNLVIAKLLETNILTDIDKNNIITFCEKTNNSKKKSNVYSEYFANKMKSVYDFTNLFPSKVNTFVMLCNQLEYSTPTERFYNDVFIIINSICEKLIYFFKQNEFICQLLKEKNITSFKTNPSNIMQLLKIIDNDLFKVMLIFKSFLPNCYVAMISKFIIHHVYLYKNDIAILDPIFVRQEDFSTQLDNDYVLGVNKHNLKNMEKIIEMNPDVAMMLNNTQEFTNYDNFIDPDYITTLKKFVVEYEKTKQDIKNAYPINIDELENIDQCV